MSKLDIKSAFCNIPVHPSDWELLSMKWEGLYFFEMTLPFSLRSAPFLFDEFSSALEWIIQNKHPQSDPHTRRFLLCYPLSGHNA